MNHIKTAQDLARSTAQLKAYHARMRALPPEERRAKYVAKARKAVITRTQKLHNSAEQSMSPIPAHSPAPAESIEQSPTHDRDGSIAPFPGGDSKETRGHYLKWTMIESRTVAQETAIQLLKRNISHIPPINDRLGSAMLLECIVQAQIIAIPQRERRKLHVARSKIQGIFWHFLAEALKEIERQKNTERVTGVIAEKPSDAPIAQPEKPQAVKPQGVFESLIDERIQAMLKPLEDLYTEELDRLGKEIAELKVQVAKKSEPVAYQPPEDKFPTVGIFGCLPAQFENLRKKVEEMKLRCELKFYNQESKEKPSTEWALFMRWSSHKHWNEAKSMGLDPHKMAFIHSGFSSAVRQLEDWFTPIST